MATTGVRNAAEYESRLQQFVFERAEEGRAVRVGEKEVSEQAAIIERYRDLFTREQLDALRTEESGADGEERERLWKLAAQQWPAYDDYQEKTDREIPVVVLERA